MKDHHYQISVTWTGNTGKGTQNYKAYERDHLIQVAGKPGIEATSEVSYYGNKIRYNPEELLVASLSACHMLWYLHLCAVNNIVVTAYKDNATGTYANHSRWKWKIYRSAVTTRYYHRRQCSTYSALMSCSGKRTNFVLSPTPAIFLYATSQIIFSCNENRNFSYSTSIPIVEIKMQSIINLCIFHFTDKLSSTEMPKPLLPYFYAPTTAYVFSGRNRTDSATDHSVFAKPGKHQQRKSAAS